MPPKRTRVKKIVKEEQTELPSLEDFILRGVDIDLNFTSISLNALAEFGECLQEHTKWITNIKAYVKQDCEDIGGSKAVPKTPKRENAFAKIKDTIDMFDNLGISLANKHNSRKPLNLDRDDEAEENIPPSKRSDISRRVKCDTSPVPPPITTPMITDREIKEEIHSTGSINEKQPKEIVESETPVRSTRLTRSKKIVNEDSHKPPSSTPSRDRLDGISSSPSRNLHKSPSRVNPIRHPPIAATRTVVRVLINETTSTSSSISSSPIKHKNQCPKPAPRNLNCQGKSREDERRAETLRKLEEKGNAAVTLKEEQLREKADRARKDREERALKVKAKQLEEEQKREQSRIERIKKENAVAELQKRNGQSPSRQPKTPIRRNQSPDGIRKRLIQSPHTPGIPYKHHRTANNIHPRMVTEWSDTSEDDERMRRERLELDRKRRMEEEALMKKKMKEEEERVARIKEDEKKREEERKRREEEKARKDREERDRIEKEKERRLKEETEKKMKTPVVFKHKQHILNESQSSSYDMTPEKIVMAASDTNYGVDDLSSGDETDDEENPKKKVPKWASQPYLSRTLENIRHNPPFDCDTFFGDIIEPDLNVIFKPSNKYPKRTSSAMWNSPLTNPTKGKSRFFAQ